MAGFIHPRTNMNRVWGTTITQDEYDHAWRLAKLFEKKFHWHTAEELYPAALEGMHRAKDDQIPGSKKERKSYLTTCACNGMRQFMGQNVSPAERETKHEPILADDHYNVDGLESPWEMYLPTNPWRGVERFIDVMGIIHEMPNQLQRDLFEAVVGGSYVKEFAHENALSYRNCKHLWQTGKKQIFKTLGENEF